MYINLNSKDFIAKWFKFTAKTSKIQETTLWNSEVISELTLSFSGNHHSKMKLTSILVPLTRSECFSTLLWIRTLVIAIFDRFFFNLAQILMFAIACISSLDRIIHNVYLPFANGFPHKCPPFPFKLCKSTLFRKC